jgi:type V secretory pathway adhesin AidA
VTFAFPSQIAQSHHQKNSRKNMKVTYSLVVAAALLCHPSVSAQQGSTSSITTPPSSSPPSLRGTSSSYSSSDADANTINYNAYPNVDQYMQEHYGSCYKEQLVIVDDDNDDTGIDTRGGHRVGCAAAFMAGCNGTNAAPACADNLTDAYNLGSKFCGNFITYPFPNNDCFLKYKCC